MDSCAKRSQSLPLLYKVRVADPSCRSAAHLVLVHHIVKLIKIDIIEIIICHCCLQRAGALTPHTVGFQSHCTRSSPGMLKQCAVWLRGKLSCTSPWLFCASIIELGKCGVCMNHGSPMWANKTPSTGVKIHFLIKQSHAPASFDGPVLRNRSLQHLPAGWSHAQAAGPPGQGQVCSRLCWAALSAGADGKWGCLLRAETASCLPAEPLLSRPCGAS